METQILMPTKLDSGNSWKMSIWKTEEIEQEHQDGSCKDRLIVLEVNKTDSDFDIVI